MAVLFPLETNGFSMGASSAVSRSDWAPLRAIEYRLKLGLLLFDTIVIEFIPLLHLGITQLDDSRISKRKVQDWIDAVDAMDNYQTTTEHRTLLEWNVDTFFPGIG